MSNWFADKLGPIPKASPKQGKTGQQKAAAPQQASTKAAPAKEPEKKKKGWF